MGAITVPSTKELQTLKTELAPTGKLTRCIEAGFMRGSVNGEQAAALKQQLSNLVEYSQELQKQLFQLQTELAQAKQSTLFN